MFPQYNPEIPLSQQPYFPTDSSPPPLPQHVISRSSLHASRIDARDYTQASAGPGAAADAPAQQHPGDSGRWRRRISDQRGPSPQTPSASSTAALKGLWKAANGWRAPPSEGQVYCLKLTQEKDAPVYTLSGAGQPFYNLRLDPTSVSAKVTLRRYDPSKPYRANSANSANSANPATDTPRARASIIGGVSQKPTDGKKHWQEVLCTALEEPARRHSPEDGLVALLYPSAASRAALGRPDDPHTVALAERECGRLVWDDDSGSHFVLHPALAAPFCVGIERTPTWSRVTYTLEHPESPQHLARLTRDGTGAGWFEIDTRLASHIDAYYAIDVAVAALLTVAASDESFRAVEAFEPPPLVMFPPPAAFADTENGRRWSGRFSLRGRDRERQSDEQMAAGAARPKMGEFEMDVESQSSSFAKAKRSRRRRSGGSGGGGSGGGMHGWPIWARCMVGSVTMALKCLLWCITLLFRALARCLGVK